MLETCRASPEVKELMFGLNDINPSIIARNGLLLAACEEMDPSSSRDLDFLWSIWYNLELSNSHHHKMKRLVEKLLQGSDHGWFKFSPRSWKAVSEVLHLWLVDADDLPNVQTVKQERIARIEKYFGMQLHSKKAINYKDMATHVIHPIAYCLGPEKINVEDAGTHWVHGSIHAQGKAMASVMIPNVTLLHHKTQKWLGHYSLCPFRTYLSVISKKQVQNAGGLAPACQKHLGIWVQELRKRIKAESIEILLSAENALDYCWHEEIKFDVVDTSNLADHVGLLNLLVFGGSRLAPRANSKLFTSVLLWHQNPKPISDFISKSLGFDVAMTPSMLGLRLVSSDHKEIEQFAAEVAGIQNEKPIQWQPSLVPIPPLTVDLDNMSRAQMATLDASMSGDVCAITTALCRLASACCFLPQAEPCPRGEISCHMSTVATVASLVYSLCESRIQLASNQSPEDMLLAVCVGYCAAFALEAEVVLRLMDPTRGSLVQFTGLTSSQLEQARMTMTFRIFLVHKSLVAQSGMMDESMQLNYLCAKMMHKDFREDKVVKLVHFIDSVSINDDHTVSFLLPEDHGLRVSDWKVIQINIAEPILHSLSTMTNMSDFSPRNVKYRDNLKKLAAGKADNSGTGSLRIEYVKEFNDMFVACIQYEGSPEGLFTKYYQQLKDKLVSPSLAVDVGFKKPEEKRVTIRFSSPVTPEGSAFRLLQTDSKVECNFRKASSWPS